jgi:NAD(P)H-flavin reductase
VERAYGHDVLIVAGGIGLAPLRPVIYYMLNHREKFGNITILYGARTPTDILFRNELKKWRGRFDLEIHVTVDRTGETWHGNVGVVTELIGKVEYEPANTIAMMCGPEIMMRFTVSALLKRDFAENNIFVSMERNMKCGIGLCGHCQMGTEFICKDGPVYSYDYIKKYFVRREI